MSHIVSYRMHIGGNPYMYVCAIPRVTIRLCFLVVNNILELFPVRDQTLQERESNQWWTDVCDS
jgi:hypothetical protein